MIVGAVGFSYSGSSAVVEYLMEFNKTHVNRHEFIFAYHPDCLSDLDFHLNENCAKFLSSGVAIPRFRKAAINLLEGDTKGKIKELTDEYLESLIQVSWIGSEQGQSILHNRWVYAYFGRKIMYDIFLTKLPSSFTKKIKLYPLDKMNFSIQPDDFINKTQQYTDKILESMGYDLEKIIVLDQPFPGNKPSRTMRYFRDSKAIIVDRDPRDIYAGLNLYFDNKLFSVPSDDIDKYIIYYRELHKNLAEEIENEDVLYIHFEDMVYNYEETTKRIDEFLGLKDGDHTNKKMYFEPEKSIANTQMFVDRNEIASDIKRIEEELSEYLYDFDSALAPQNHNGVFGNNANAEKYRGPIT